jgi:SAM-dependent methyltransferase
MYRAIGIPESKLRWRLAPGIEAQTPRITLTYADLTTSDPNPVKRWIQGRRLSDALKFLRDADAVEGARILDFGSGDGELVRRIGRRWARPIEAWVYEPSSMRMAEARRNLEGFGRVSFVTSTTSIESGSFDFVFCLEVLEHLPPAEMRAACEEIHRLVKTRGLVVIGVPHELFLPALVKGIFRMFRRYGSFDANPRNVFAAVTGRPPLVRPAYRSPAGLMLHPEHLGFDFRALKHALCKHFVLERMWFSPFAWLGSVFNFEVYFLARKGD